MKNVRGILKRIIFVLTGSFLNSIAINAFIIPNRFLSGGVAGAAIIIQYLSSISSGYLILILNIPIFLIGMREVDKEFIFFSLLGMLSLSAFLVATRYAYIYVNATQDPLLSSIYAGVLSGAGLGTVFRNRASMGGTDIIAVVLKRRLGINISTLSLSINVVIVSIGMFISGIEIGLYTLVAMYITSVVMDRVIEGFDRKKLLFIVTSMEEEVSDIIMKSVGRGVTFLYGEGAYTGEKKKILYCIVTINQLSRVKKIIEDTDPEVFMSVLDASEVQGRGFKRPAL